MAAEQPVVVREESFAYHLELNREDCGNLVTMEMVDQITRALEALPSAAKLVVISGRGADFCRGRDYRDAPESAQGRTAPSAQAIRERMTDPIVRMYSAIRNLPVPAVSIVQGHALGFGCALSASCDIVIAAESARFQLPEMQKGLPPTLAMTALFGRLSVRALTFLVYSGAEIGADTALTLGLASRVVKDVDLATERDRWIDTLSGYPADAVRAVKAYLNAAPDKTSGDRASLGAEIFARVMSSR